MKAKRLLAIETSTPVARVGVFDIDGGACLAEASATSERHSSNLLRLCVDVTARAGVAISDLAAIACGAGPGSFTGLRVGFAVAKGFALPFAIPLVTVSSLQVLARDMAGVDPSAAWLLPCLDAGKGQIYAAAFAVVDGDPQRRSEDWVVAPGAVLDVAPGQGTVLFAGTGAARYREPLQEALGTRGRFVEVAGPSAVSVAAYAGERFRKGTFEDLNSVVPAYGRAPDITRPKKSGP